MAKDNVKYGYAQLDNTEHTISIDDIDRSFAEAHKFYCPHCHKEMYATFGQTQVKHFRHNGEKCRYSQYLHALAEQLFFEEYSKCLENGLPFYLEAYFSSPCNKACVLKKHYDCKEHYIKKTIDLTQEYKKILLEERVEVDDSHYCRPDILLKTADGKQLWVEIWVSHETEDTKRERGQIIEIKINTEKDLETIKQHKIVQSEGDDKAVRIFGNVIDEVDFIFPDDNDELSISYPCDNYFCFEVDRNSRIKEKVIQEKEIRYVITIHDNLLYQVILRLNWYGHHYSSVREKKPLLYNLRDYCLQRFYAHCNNEPFLKYMAYNSLVEHEWKAESITQVQVNRSTPRRRSSLRTYNPPALKQDVAPFNIADIEWIDLGLPSGALWANINVDRTMTFHEAQIDYRSLVPSLENAEELKQYCKIIWDDTSKVLLFIGQNGNTISFPCRTWNDSYWLNGYNQGSREYGQCFHIGPDMHFYINDKHVASEIYVRLIKRLGDL